MSQGYIVRPWGGGEPKNLSLLIMHIAVFSVPSEELRSKEMNDYHLVDFTGFYIVLVGRHNEKG